MVAVQRLQNPGVWALGLSVLLHGVFFVRLATETSSRPVPLGVWVEVPPAPSRPVAARPKRTAPASTDADFAEKAASTPAPAAAPAQPTGPAGQLDGAAVSARDRYLYELEQHLNLNKEYPLRARRLGLEGRVEVAFHLHHDGRISDPHVVRPCIHDILNEAALKTVAQAGNYKPLPPEIPLPVLHVTVPIQYEL